MYSSGICTYNYLHIPIFYAPEGGNIIYETKFDKEYQTQYLAEVNFLTEKGIRYSFVKKVNGFITYKYEKTRILFKALLEFYS